MIDQRSHENRSSGPVLVKLLSLGLWLPIIALLSAPFFYWDGGILEGEATLFIRQYLDERNVVQKVFDPAKNDFFTYQARELSYFVDYLDAQYFRLLLENGVLFFVPVSLVLAALTTVAVFHYGVRRAMPGLNAVTSKLVILLYLSSFVYLATMGVYYRAAKPLLAPTLLALMLYVTFLLKSGPKTPMRRGRVPGIPFFGVLALSSLMSLWDRQGFLYSMVTFIVLTVYSLLQGQRRDLVLASLGAVCFGSLYNFVLGPLIIRAVNGYWPSFWYQKVSPSSFLTQPSCLINASELLILNVRMLLGNFPARVYIAIAIPIIMLKYFNTIIIFGKKPADDRAGIRPTTKRRSLIGLFIVIIIICSHIVMISIMILRHRFIYEYDDHIIWYYPMPSLVVLMYGVLMFLDKLMPSLGRGQAAAVNLLLVAAVAGNVASWPRHREVMLHAPWFPRVYHQTAALKQSLRDGKACDDLKDEYARLYVYLNSTVLRK